MEHPENPIVEIKWSGQPGSNRRHPAWEAGVLPLNYARTERILTLRVGVPAQGNWRPNAFERKTAIWPRVKVFPGQKLSPPHPPVIPEAARASMY